MAGVAWRKPKENSIAALEYGMEHADGVEMDLRLTLEGEVVIHHDPRTPSGKYPERYGYDDLKPCLEANFQKNVHKSLKNHTWRKEHTILKHTF